MTGRNYLQQSATRLHSELKVAYDYARALSYETGGESIGRAVLSDIGERMERLEAVMHDDDCHD